jgi:hypothetical protein
MKNPPLIKKDNAITVQLFDADVHVSISSDEKKSAAPNGAAGLASLKSELTSTLGDVLTYKTVSSAARHKLAARDITTGAARYRDVPQFFGWTSESCRGGHQLQQEASLDVQLRQQVNGLLFDTVFALFMYDIPNR